MKVGWHDVTLGEHVDLVTGFPFKSARFLDNSTAAVRLLRGDNVGQGFLRWDGAKHWPEGEAPDYLQFALEERDVILAMDRPWIEAGLKYAWVRPSDSPCLLVQRVARLRGINGLLTDYLRYIIGSSAFTAHVKSITTGVNVPHISPKDIKRFRFSLPPVAEQRRIVSILGAYDDLIEVNRRRIALLEEMARRLFEEWFVRLRFPGHERHKMAETPDGTLPEGWNIRRIGDLTSFLSRGIAPKYDATATTLVINQKCIRDQRLSLAAARAQNKAVPEEKLVRTGDVLINSTGVGTLGRVAQVEEVPDGLTVDSHVTIVRANPTLDLDFFGLSLLRMEPVFERLGAGATGQTELNRGRISDQTLLVAPLSLQVEFGGHARPVRSLAFKLAQHGDALIRSRDLVLPRLISGELSVGSAERKLEAVA